MNTGSSVLTADRTEYHREKDLGFLITWRLLVASDLAEICRIDQSMFGKGNPTNEYLYQNASWSFNYFMCIVVLSHEWKMKCLPHYC